MEVDDDDSHEPEVDNDDHEQAPSLKAALERIKNGLRQTERVALEQNELRQTGWSWSKSRMNLGRLNGRATGPNCLSREWVTVGQHISHFQSV